MDGLKNEKYTRSGPLFDEAELQNYYFSFTLYKIYFSYSFLHVYLI